MPVRIAVLLLVRMTCRKLKRPVCLDPTSIASHKDELNASKQAYVRVMDTVFRLSPSVFLSRLRASSSAIEYPAVPNAASNANIQVTFK